MVNFVVESALYSESPVVVLVLWEGIVADTEEQFFLLQLGGSDVTDLT